MTLKKKTSKENTSIVEFTATNTIHILKDEIFMDFMDSNELKGGKSNPE